MKSALALTALVASSQALVAREGSCCAGITVYGGPGGPMGQLGDGQNRIGDGSLPAGSYCLGANGGFTDEKGRGCILTPPTTQWQCDEGAAPTPGFEISCNGTVSYKGENTFYACPTGDKGGYNIYEMRINGEPNCVPIWLHMDGCYTPCPQAPPLQPQPAPAACPAELTGEWQFPHLIIPVDSTTPNKAYGTQYNSTVSGTVSSIFNFDIPPSYAGKQCSLEFLFPTQDQLETSAFEFTPGQFDFAFLDGVANTQTTHANQPKVLYDFGNFQLKPGTATEIGQCPDGCPSGQTVSFSMSARGGAALNYFQDSNPCPIGLYLTAQ